MSEDHVVRHGAPTLAGIKTGSLFTCPVEDRKGFLREVSRYDRQLAPRGIRLRVLRFSERGALLYLLRPERLRRDLADPAARRLLGGLGFGDRPWKGCCAR